MARRWLNAVATLAVVSQPPKVELAFSAITPSDLGKLFVLVSEETGESDHRMKEKMEKGTKSKRESSRVLIKEEEWLRVKHCTTGCSGVGRDLL